jgi:hypothetical protein
MHIITRMRAREDSAVTPAMISAGIAAYESLDWDSKLSSTIGTSDGQRADLVNMVYLAMADAKSGSPPLEPVPTAQPPIAEGLGRLTQCQSP